MSRSLDPTLLSLLPTYHSAAALPPSLVELASSLLAQSRHNASTLKAEEEVARLYACAHLACERLKTTLDLPPIQARPPVPPRIYKRLYTHLDHILPASILTKSGGIRTPGGKVRDTGFGLGSASAQRIRERATPSKESALAQFTSKSGTPTKSTGKAAVPSTARKTRDALPQWVKSTIRSICMQLNSERIGRTVLAGVQTIVVPHGKRTEDEWINEHLTPLLAAVYFLVSIRFTMLETKQRVNSEQYASLRKDIVKALREAHKAVDLKGQDESVLWEGWTSIGPKDLDEAVAKANENGWQDDEWFTSIGDQVGEGADVEMADPQNDTTAGKAQVQRGDTMLQRRWVMNDQKRQDYNRWKADILKRCDEIERTGGTMDVDVPT